LAPSIGFKLFPSGDNPNIDFELTARQGTDVAKMAEIMSGVDLFVSQIPELKSYTIDIANTKASIGLSLVKKEERTRDSFAIQAEVESGLAYLKTQGYKFEGKVQA
jgi:multidrug efflux pump subunit AcrB